MKRKNATRSALFTSIISLLLCVSMLVGTTFAWFTDEVKSGVNTIAAGNLDVELYHGKDANPVDKVDEGTLLFTDVGGNVIDQWEPGVVAFTNLKIANVGTLALKYQLSINSTEMNYVKGTDLTLADALQVAVVEGGVSGDRAAVIAKGTEAGWEDLESFTLPGVLEADKKSETYGIVIYWEPGANEHDNQFNMNNGKTTSDGKPLTITLGVNLFATQEMYEDDSFGPDYDGAASWVTLADTRWYTEETTEYIIYSAEELAGLAQLVNGGTSFAGKTVKLGGNIDLAGHEWTPIGNWDNTFEGTFDGQDYTISNLYINDLAGEGVGLFGVAQNATIKGINVHNVNIAGYSMVAGVVGAAYPASISDCHITGDVKIVADWAYVAGVAGYCYYGTQVDDCSVIAEDIGLIQSVTRNAVGGITAWLLEGDHKVTDCHVKNLNLVGWTNVGGITGFVHYNNTIEGCSVENVKLTKTREDGNPGIGLIAGGWSYSASNAITLRNNTVKTATLEGTHIAYSAYNVLYGSEYGGATNNNFNLENNSTENITNNLVEITKVSDGIIENNGVYQIYNTNGLKSLSATRISGNYELIADIDMGGADFSAMIVNRNDSATFNGNGFTISNVNVVSGADDNTTGQASLFYTYTNSTLNVSDLTFKDITVTADANDTGYAAAVVGYCEGTAVLNNVDVVNANITGSKSSGLLVGHLTGTGSLTAKDCDVTGTVTLSDYEANGHYAGKYIGTVAGPAALNNCKANVTVSGNLNAANDGTVYGRKTAAGSLTVDGAAYVTNAAELKAALTSASANIVLTNDLELDGEDLQLMDSSVGATAQSLFSVIGDKNVTIDLNGNTIVADTAGGNNVWTVFYAGQGANLTVTGGRIEFNSKGRSAGTAAFTTFGSNSVITLKDVEVEQVGEGGVTQMIYAHGAPQDLGKIYVEGGTYIQKQPTSATNLFYEQGGLNTNIIVSGGTYKVYHDVDLTKYMTLADGYELMLTKTDDDGAKWYTVVAE